ncbi:M48 family metallopeptidase [Wenzhouxiangella sp. AB-CW3]|uniref:M48 family metallopeptidase n=1 Tax=Wenzhouxiangella sp. AB-CW3 TaxID=2771012 RepID=UPI00168B0BC7|nr:M48 family metallopeptidase [Wenzhouxiangella sp. AB-CW3]QOC22844.1 M48 family metallopeptidase [Wenzhouxiangella sp. AB-CW3]
MNFFEHQDRARRQTGLLVFLFGLAVLGIVLAANAVVLFTVGPDPELLVGVTIFTGGTILLASLVRTMQMRSGGGEVARQLGGTLVDHDTSDPLRRRLRNVVEEMAIASGVPVPEIYVLEHEQGINAFAAGYSPADAAVAVTRGALENLDRHELQGVIAHEFSHILNGDMRLNIRLIGFLFGILVIAILGRRMLFSARFARDSRGAGGAVMIGLVIVIIGYIGLFFGRWIRAAVSRQREFLADASAVQFTRHPDGIAGALKKIKALYAGSYLTTDAEEVGHMMFGQAMGYQMFATHPPLEDRIRAIDPSFQPDDIERIARRMDRHSQARAAEAEEAAREETPERGPGGLTLDADRLSEKIGQPGLSQVFLAAALVAAIPRQLERAAHSDEWAQEVICYLLLSDDPDVREEQLLAVVRSLGSESEGQVRALRQSVPDLPHEQRLPLLEMAFPSLRRRPERELLELMRLVEALVAADGRMDVFEYALARLTNRQIQDALQPGRVRQSGNRKLTALKPEVIDLLVILAWHGHPDRPEAVQSALESALAQVELDMPSELPNTDDWTGRLDAALNSVDRLKPSEKKRLVDAMACCVLDDGQVIPDEMDLLRVICGLLHVPIPMLEQASEEADQEAR